MTVSRQHASTEVTELVGAVCERLLAVPGAASDTVATLYLRAGRWYRFFLDGGLLFLDESDGPDPVADLAPGAEYVDLGETLKCEGHRIREMHMHDAVLALRFDSGVSLRLTDTDNETKLEVER